MPAEVEIVAVVPLAGPPTTSGYMAPIVLWRRSAWRSSAQHGLGSVTRQDLSHGTLPSLIRCARAVVCGGRRTQGGSSSSGRQRQRTVDLSLTNRGRGTAREEG